MAAIPTNARELPVGSKEAEPVDLDKEVDAALYDIEAAYAEAEFSAQKRAHEVLRKAYDKLVWFNADPERLEKLKARFLDKGLRFTKRTSVAHMLLRASLGKGHKAASADAIVLNAAAKDGIKPNALIKWLVEGSGSEAIRKGLARGRSPLPGSTSIRKSARKLPRFDEYAEVSAGTRVLVIGKVDDDHKATVDSVAVLTNDAIFEQIVALLTSTQNTEDTNDTEF